MAPEYFTSHKVSGEDGQPVFLTTFTLQADIWSAGMLERGVDETYVASISDLLSLCLQRVPAVRPGFAELRKVPI